MIHQNHLKLPACPYRPITSLWNYRNIISIWQIPHRHVSFNIVSYDIMHCNNLYTLNIFYFHLSYLVRIYAYVVWLCQHWDEKTRQLYFEYFKNIFELRINKFSNYLASHFNNISVRNYHKTQNSRLQKYEDHQHYMQL